jgi:hypothetical protein
MHGIFFTRDSPRDCPFHTLHWDNPSFVVGVSDSFPPDINLVRDSGIKTILLILVLEIWLPYRCYGFVCLALVLYCLGFLRERAGTGTQFHVRSILFKEPLSHIVTPRVSSQPISDFFVDLANVEIIGRKFVDRIVAEIIIKQCLKPE